MYSFGFTVFPDEPTCLSLGSHPLSTTGREQPTSPFSAPASSTITPMFFSSLIPLPTETTISASEMSTSPGWGSTYPTNLFLPAASSWGYSR